MITQKLPETTSNFIRVSTEAAVHGCSGIHSQEIPVGDNYYSKVTGLKPVTFLQLDSGTGGFL